MPLIYYHYICIMELLCWQSFKNPASRQFFERFDPNPQRLLLLPKEIPVAAQVENVSQFKHCDISSFNKTRNYETDGSPPQNVVKCMLLPQPSMAGALFCHFVLKHPESASAEGLNELRFWKRIKKLINK